MLDLVATTYKPGDAQSFVDTFGRNVKKFGGYWKISCINTDHEDNHASMSVQQKPDGIAIKCHVGCDNEVCLRSVGLTKLDLIKPEHRTNGTKPRPKAVRRTDYLYRDITGKVIYKRQRVDYDDGDKDVFIYHPSGSDWKSGQGGVELTLYRLPELDKADPGDVVWWVEGEKCCEDLERRGLVSTTSGNADSWNDSFARFLKDRVVVILPDNDTKGRAHAEAVARGLDGIASHVKVVHLPGLAEKQDVYDWLRIGNTVDDLERLAMETPAWQPKSAPTVQDRTVEPQPATAHVSSTWADMGAILGDLEWHWPNYMPLGMITALVAAGDAGKSQMALHIAQRTLYGGFWPDGSPVEATGKVIWLDTEGSDLITYKRMLEWGINPQDIIKPRVGDDLLNGVLLDTPQGLEALEREIILHLPRLVVIDTLRGAHTQKERDDDAMQSLLKTLATFAARYRCAMLINHHITKKHPAENLNVITLDRVRGSSVIANMARVILAIDQPDPENDRRRVQVIKCNLAPKAAPLGMDIDTQGLTFTEHAPGEPPRDTTFNRAIEFLKARLANGPDLTNVLEADAKEQGISVATLNRARKLLRVVSLGKSASGWLVSLPAEIND